jgi:hypothetical protein
MALIIKKYKRLLISFVCVSAISLGFGQNDTDIFRFQLGLGVNNPIDNGENDGYYSKSLNLPTVNLGLQYMFTSQFGGKLDFGFNRAKSADGSIDFKLNYARVNAQVVYDFSRAIGFLPEPMSILAHAGPGMSFTKPLANDAENKYTYLNGLIGMEIHYKLSKTLSIFGDVGYAKSFSGQNKYDIAVDGYSFNGDLIYATVGLSVAISGCRYCN